MPYRSGSYALTPPSWPIFIVSVVLAIAALLVRYAGISIPILNTARVFDVLALAYLILALGVLLRRL
jgi:hypothetical protein